MERLGKVLFFIIVTCPLVLIAANEWFEPDFLGQWQFEGIILDGVYQNRPNENLILTFDFKADGTDVLHWQRIGEEGYCERHGKWSYENDVLKDEVVWVDPNNKSECAGDSDMQLGKISYTPLWVENGQLHTEFPFADKVIIYVWNKLDGVDE